MDKVLIVNEGVLIKLREKFDLSDLDEASKVATYKSPNGYINRRVSLIELERYSHPSNFSLPTSDLTKYEKISEDLLDYKKFMDAFELEDFEAAIQKIIDKSVIL